MICLGRFDTHRSFFKDQERLVFYQYMMIAGVALVFEVGLFYNNISPRSSHAFDEIDILCLFLYAFRHRV